MVVTRKYSTKGFSQERLAKDDIRLLLQLIELYIMRCGELPDGTTPTRIELLVGKLKRMEKQK